MDKDASLFQLFCIAIVAKDKPTDTDVIDFFPVEHLSLATGDVNKVSTEGDVTIDISGVKYVAKVDRGYTLPATWFPDGDSARQTSPDVINGETVKVYRYGNSETYFWTTMFREPALRRTEHVVYAYGNLPNGRSPWGMDSSYGITWSTKDKHVTMHTSMSNGEAFSYRLKFDTANSTWDVQDNVGNGFGIDSNRNRTHMQTEEGTTIEQVGKNQNITVPETQNTQTKTHNHTSESYNLEVQSYVINADNYQVNTPSAQFSTEITVPHLEAARITLAGRDLKSWLDSKD